MSKNTHNNKKKLVLLDSHAIIHRAYHALPDFSSSKGEPTGALYGLSTMLMKIVSELKPDYVAACYDLPGKTFRHEAYDAYKAGRAKTDDALVAQLQSSRKIFDAFGIPIYDAPGFEADDILGTISEQFKKEKNLEIIIASGDMDTMQLIDGKRVQVYTLKKGLNDTILYDEDAVRTRFGFGPELLPDYKGLRGDPSDNIIGIKGIGEKTATDLIVNFGGVEDIYKKLKKKEKDFLDKGIKPRIIELLKAGEEEALFSKTLATIRRDAPIAFTLPAKTFRENLNIPNVEKLFLELEFRSLSARLRAIFGASPEAKELGSPASKENQRKPDFQVDPDDLLEVSVAVWLLNSDLANPNLEDILFYAKAADFEKARASIFEKLKKEKLDRVYEEIEKPLMPIIKKMQDRGILIDKKFFTALSTEYHAELDKLTKKIHSEAGTEFNINSPKQLSEVLFGKLGLAPKGKKKEGGAYSTRAEVLEELAEEHPIVREILAYRELQKLLSTYIDVIPALADEEGRLHAKFIQAGSSTGRFSSQDPNLQNIPIKTDLGRRIRGGFVAAPGHKLLALDYSQIELRVAALMSADEKMTAIFREGKDIHAGVASFVFGVPMEEVDREMRRRSKIINFGIIYGMGVSALRKNLGGTREEAQKFYDNYFRQFSRVEEFMEESKNFARQHGYSETLFGRRRNFANINSRIPFIKNMAERTAANAPLQGTAADIIKLAIRFAEEDLQKAGLITKAHLLLQIHDELVYEIEESALPKAEEIIKKAMQDVLARSYLHYKTDIPLEVHSGAGANLGEVK